ncbi:hypothetical protein GC163_19965 [bacterium]|nr:hypothetical protein [bacterium]
MILTKRVSWFRRMWLRLLGKPEPWANDLQRDEFLQTLNRWDEARDWSTLAEVSEVRCVLLYLDPFGDQLKRQAFSLTPFEAAQLASLQGDEIARTIARRDAA